VPTPSKPLPLIAGGPEDLFRLEPVRYDGERLTGSMLAGPWVTGDDGRTPAGAVGVLLDDVLGYALIDARPEGRWSVSAEITLDVLEPLPTEGRIHAVADLVHVGGLGAFATGRLTDDDGRLVAVGTQRGRFVPMAGDPGSPSYAPVEGSTDAVRWLDSTYAGPEPFVVPDLMANPLGNVHGGMSLCLSDLVARGAVADHLTTASLHITYTRAIPVGATLAYTTEVHHEGRSLAVVDVTARVDGRPATVARVVLHPRTG
jgi:acyl-coenzyme A thioesterase PaaI-like protein